MIDPHYFIRIDSGNSTTFGNVFLTHDWKLYVDMETDQHDKAMKRLGIHLGDVLLSGCIRLPGVVSRFSTKTSISWRTPPGVDRGDITNDEAIRLYRLIEAIICQ